jgi:hypothetical protein
MRLDSRWLVWFCLSLMLWTAAAESTHHHPQQTESSSCSICVVAHSATPAAISNHSRPVFATLGLLHEVAIIANARLQVFDLGIRGPPAV